MSPQNINPESAKILGMIGGSGVLLPPEGR